MRSLRTGLMPVKRPQEPEIRDINKVNSIKITLASPGKIRDWSYGEVKNPETIDYKTHKPKPDGLFCERIFGPTKDYECSCGKFKGIKHKGLVCDRCGVELTQSKVRRSRLGHIELEMPVAHIWFSKGVPSRMAALIDLSIKNLERVLYYEDYIVIDGRNTPLKSQQLLTEEEYREACEKFPDGFEAGMGAEAVKTILEKMDLDSLATKLRKQIKTETSKQRMKKATKRLGVVEGFRGSNNRPEWMILEVLPLIPPDLRPLVPLEGGRFATSDLNDLYRRVINRNNRLRRLKEVRAPEVIIRNEKRMLQEAVDALLDNGRRGRPVKGSNNRPLKSLSDMLKGKQGRFRQNLLGKRVDYSGRSVIVVGPELKLNQCGLPKKMALELFEPFIIRRMEELDEDITIRTAKKRIEKEAPEVFDVLDDVIKGHPILLNRAPTLHRLGIQAFMPVLIEGKAIQLHPMSCAAFNADFDGDQMAVHIPLSREAQMEAKVLMLSTKNILSPADGKPVASPSQDIVLGCYYLTKSGADPWLPLIMKASAETTLDERRQMLEFFFPEPYSQFVNPFPRYRQLLSKVGDDKDKAVEKFTDQDIMDLQVWFSLSRAWNEAIKPKAFSALDKQAVLQVLIEKDKKFKQEDKDLLRPLLRQFSSIDEARIAYDNGIIGLQEEIRVRIKNEAVKTTIGRIFFNEALPENFDFVNKLMDKKELSRLVSRIYFDFGQAETAVVLDKLKTLGFTFAKHSGLSISVSDLVVPPEKREIIAEADEEVRKVMDQFRLGAITDVERYNKIVDTWQRTTYDVGSAMMKRLEKDQCGFNPVFMILNSASRGSKDQISQLAGMRGVMNRPTKKMTGAVGEVIESPIKSNFKEGLTMLEYFISTHGARKGLADTALKTAEAGYLTRRLVDVAQDVIVNEDDCGTMQGVEVGAIRAGDLVFEGLKDRIVGRVSLDDIYNPLSSEREVLVAAGEIITPEIADKIVLCGIEQVFIRTVMTCETRRGICAKCYGWDMTRGKLVEVGEAAGVIAAQSIGEPGTQLTLRTFHIGGTTSRVLRQSDARVGKLEQDEDGFRLGEFGHLKFINVKTVRDRRGQETVINRAGRMIVARAGIKADGVAKGTTGRIIHKNIETVKDSEGRIIVINSDGSIELQYKNKTIQENFSIPHGAEILVPNDSRANPGQEIAKWEPFTRPILAEVAGKTKLTDIERGENLINKGTSRKPRWVIAPSKGVRPTVSIEDSKGKVLREVSLFPGCELFVTDAQKVQPGDVLALMDTPIISSVEGKCRFIDLEEGLTLRKQLDENETLQSFVIEGKGKPGSSTAMQPRLAIVGKGGVVLHEYHVPPGYFLTIEEGDDVFDGTILARADQVVQEKFQNIEFLPTGSTLHKSDGQRVERDDILASWDPYSVPIVAEAAGKCQYNHMEQGVTYSVLEKKGEAGAQAQRMIMEHKEEFHPSLIIQDEASKKVYHYPLPTGSQVMVGDGDNVHPGDVLAKIPQESTKSRDVTGGLPRVEEILEARRPKPKELSVISRYDGWVRIPQPGGVDEDLEKKIEAKGYKKKRGVRWVLVMNNEGEILDAYKVDTGKHLCVSDGDWVQHGDKLADGSIDPHEYLAVMGERKTQEYLLNEIQEVYRLQNVSINDKHIEIIIRQMMKKVRVTDPGDTDLLHDEIEDRFSVLQANAKAAEKGERPAKFEPCLLGITKASLGTDSFISAASFQETTRVLTQAAICGKSDPLLGLKENVIVGHLIPAGTGNPGYEYLKLTPSVEEEETSKQPQTAG